MWCAAQSARCALPRRRRVTAPHPAVRPGAPSPWARPGRPSCGGASARGQVSAVRRGAACTHATHSKSSAVGALFPVSQPSAGRPCGRRGVCSARHASATRNASRATSKQCARSACLCGALSHPLVHVAHAALLSRARAVCHASVQRSAVRQPCVRSRHRRRSPCTPTPQTHLPRGPRVGERAPAEEAAHVVRGAAACHRAKFWSPHAAPQQRRRGPHRGRAAACQHRRRALRAVAGSVREVICCAGGQAGLVSLVLVSHRCTTSELPPARSRAAGWRHCIGAGVGS
jgi:hypothetical protein